MKRFAVMLCALALVAGPFAVQAHADGGPAQNDKADHDKTKDKDAGPKNDSGPKNDPSGRGDKDKDKSGPPGNGR